MKLELIQAARGAGITRPRALAFIRAAEQIELGELVHLLAFLSRTALAKLKARSTPPETSVPGDFRRRRNLGTHYTHERTFRDDAGL